MNGTQLNHNMPDEDLNRKVYDINFKRNENTNQEVRSEKVKDNGGPIAEVNFAVISILTTTVHCECTIHILYLNGHYI